ncbi:pyridoxal phosphate-dependent aminotransferase [Litchfieldella xinjiangensis]|uniref:pyridoxal phosphate-dependent aminotransferase n=1 Tax=Litchfieldella xinjiangensis TaxID=1166948 RepID=UPI0005BDEF57|nr:pyridoxal phosphate-dependent aminotransferase [Halomonas xinjiangensis]
MRFSRLTTRIAGDGAAAWDIHYRALDRQAQGEDVIILSVGDPDFTTPEPIIDSAVASLRNGATHYADVQGKRRLRELIAQHHREVAGTPATTAENVAVVAGAQCGLYAVAQCLLDAEDEVIVFEPMYVTYEAALQAAGATLVRVPLRAEADFQPRLEDIETAVTSRTRAILVNSPHNPTGQCLTREHWGRLADLCQAHDLWMISDEVYAELIYEGQHICPASLPNMAERTAVISSLSKSHAMTGWRIGWVNGPEALIQHVSNLALCMLYGSPDFIQDAACTALEYPPQELRTMRETYQQRRDVVCQALAGTENLEVLRPSAGMFMMIDIRRTGLSAQAFADQLLNEQNVSLLSGEAFGPSAAGFVRLSLTVEADRLREACRRIKAHAQACSETDSITQGIL